MQKELDGWFSEIYYVIWLILLLMEFGAISALIGIAIYTGLFRWLLSHAMISNLFVNSSFGFSVLVGLLIFGLFVRFFIPFQQKVWKQVQKKYDLKLLRNVHDYPLFFDSLNDALQFISLEMPIIYIIDEDSPNCFTWRVNHQQILVVTTGLATRKNSKLLFRILVKQCFDLKLHFSQLRVLEYVAHRYLVMMVIALIFLLFAGVENGLGSLSLKSVLTPNYVLNLMLFSLLGWFFVCLFMSAFVDIVINKKITNYFKSYDILDGDFYLQAWFQFEHLSAVMINYSVFDYMINQLWSNCLNYGFFF